MRARTVPMLLLVAILLVACGGGSDTDTDPAPAAAPEPCSLVTKAEAEQATGVTLGEPIEEAGADGPLCRYDAGLSRVQIVVHAEPKTATELAAETAPGTAVEGVGDAAYFYSNLGELHVALGAVSFAVGVLVDGAQNPDTAKTLAIIAASRVTG